MDADVRRRFKEADRHFDELVERQRELLALMAEGLTTDEIAKSLRMSLDETKWNITATVSKLGFERREDATAYFTWRQRPFQRLRRNPGVSTAISLATLVVVALGLLMFWPAEPQGTPGAFYLEIVFDLEFPDDSAFLGESDGDPPDDGYHYRMTVRQWFEPPNLWRITAEFDYSWVDDDPTTSVRVSDGSRSIRFAEGDESSPYKEAAAPSGFEGLWWAMQDSIPVGRAPGENVGDFIARLDREEQGRTVLRTSGQLDGRDVVIFEREIENRCRTEPESLDCTKVARYWLDEGRMLILRFEVSWREQGNFSAAAELTVYDDNVTHDPALFEFASTGSAAGVTTETLEPP